MTLTIYLAPKDAEDAKKSEEEAKKAAEEAKKAEETGEMVIDNKKANSGKASPNTGDPTDLFTLGVTFMSGMTGVGYALYSMRRRKKTTLEELIEEQERRDRM